MPLLLASLTMVACTGRDTGVRSASVAPSGAEAITLAPYAERYAAITAPVEGAIATFESQSGALAQDASVDAFVVIARPFADVMGKVDIGLRQATWPPAAVHDIRAEVAADQSLQDDLIGTADVTLMVPLWRHQVLSAANKVRRARQVVSIDLGVVPPTG